MIDTRTKTRRAFYAGLMVLVLFASACSSSNDPKSWTEAGVSGDVRLNFATACIEANTDGGKLTDGQAATYCTQAFEALVDYYGGQITQPGNVLQDRPDATEGRDFAAFLQLNSDLKKDPESVPAEIRELLTSIADSVTN